MINEWERLDSSSKRDGLKQAFARLGLEYEAHFEGTTCKHVVLKRGDFKVMLGHNYGLDISRLKPETVTLYVLSGQVAGLSIRETFARTDDGWKQAYDRKCELERLKREDEKDLVIEEKEVEITKDTTA